MLQVIIVLSNAEVVHLPSSTGSEQEIVLVA